MKKMLYAILKVISWIWIILWAIMSLVLKTVGSTQPLLFTRTGVILLPILLAAPIAFLSWRFNADKEIRYQAKKEKAEFKDNLFIGKKISEKKYENKYKQLLKNKKYTNKRLIYIAVASIIIMIVLISSVLKLKNTFVNSTLGIASNSENIVSLEKAREKLKLDEKLETLFFSEGKSYTNGINIDIKVALKRYKLKEEIFDEYLNYMISEVSFVDYKRQQRISFDQSKLKDCGKLYLIQKDVTAKQYQEAGMYYKTGSGGQYEATDISITTDKYSFINDYIKKQFLENQGIFINQIDDRYKFMKEEDPKGPYYQDRIDYSQEIIDSIRTLSAKSDVQISQDTETKLKRLSDYLEVCKSQIQSKKEASNNKVPDTNAEKIYVEKVKNYLLKIGKENIIISQEINNFSSNGRLPEAMKSLSSICKELKALSAPSDRFLEIDKSIDEGCNQYIESTASIGKAVIQFDSSYIDESINQSQTAGNYFKQALAKMNEYGYKIDKG